jgi:hypothetical protein
MIAESGHMFIPRTAERRIVSTLITNTSNLEGIIALLEPSAV